MVTDDSTIDILEILRERTVVPIEALSDVAKCSQPLVQLPSYINEGVHECMEETSRSVRFVRNSGNLLTEKLKRSSRSAGRGGEHRIQDSQPLELPAKSSSKVSYLECCALWP